MKYLIGPFFLFSVSLVFGQQFKVVSVGDADLKKENIVFFSNSCQNAKVAKSRSVIYKQIKNNFAFYRHLFNITEEKGVFKPIALKELKRKNIQFMLQFTCPVLQKNAEIKVRVINILTGNELFSEVLSYNQNASEKVREKVHQLSDRLYRAVTGKKSIFTSKITFVSDLGSTRTKRFKELYIMDFDGKNVKRLTNHKRIIMSPGFSPSNNKILYSLIDKKGKGENVNLYYFDRTVQKSLMISNRSGLNAGAIYNADGKSVILTLSNKGNADIYWLDIASKKIRKITSHYSIDVDPSINRAGDLMAFLSGRAGSAMIYTLDPRGVEKNVKRISFVGKFNATPRFSPDGKKIVFSSWLDNSFDLFMIDSNGRNLVRLTKNFGSNEEPFFSPDGEFIVFTSQRVLSRYKAVQNIYIMNRMGEVLGSLTSHMGQCFSPRFSNY